MTDEELITALRMWSKSELCREAAARIEALLKERQAHHANPADFRYWEGRYRDENARALLLEAALRVARVHVANNAEGWSVSRGAARNDLTIVDAALEPQPAPDPVHRPTMTDMMVDPDTLDAFMDANPLPPAPDAAAIRVAALREALSTLDALPEYGSPDVNIGVSNAYAAILALLTEKTDDRA